MSSHGLRASGRRHRGSHTPADEDESMSEGKAVTRRSLLMGIGIAFNAIVGAAIAVPVIGYLLSPIKKKGAYYQWISLGKLDEFPEGQTRLAQFVNPFERPQDGETAKTPCWVRRLSTDKF